VPYQLFAAARLPNSGISEIAVNASLAFIEGAKPRDEVECALVIQMACTARLWRCLPGLREATAATVRFGLCLTDCCLPPAYPSIDGSAIG
jgi:hypothetical protein